MIAQEDEALLILSEECAEVSQAISKIFRFGLHNKHPKSEQDNREHLEEELGDLLCLAEILVEQGVLREHELTRHAFNKYEKLKRWSRVKASGISTDGSTSLCQSEGRRFEPDMPLQK